MQLYCIISVPLTLILFHTMKYLVLPIAEYGSSNIYFSLIAEYGSDSSENTLQKKEDKQPEIPIQYNDKSQIDGWVDNTRYTGPEYDELYAAKVSSKICIMLRSAVRFMVC